MKIFLDTAHEKDIQRLAKKGLLDGVTTNPTLLSKEVGLPTEVVKHICAMLPGGAISVEVTEKEPDAVYKQALAIAKIAPNVVVKIPCVLDYAKVIKRLVDKKIKLNITLIFSALQGLLMAKQGVAYISPFVGRLDDSGADGMAVVHDLRNMIDFYGYDQTQIIAASIRTVDHVKEAALAGADVVTLKPELFEKLLYHPMTEDGMATFAADWKKLGIKQFP